MSRGKIINIEWSANNNYNFTEQEFSEAKKTWMIHEARKAASEGYDTVIAILLVDGLLSPRPDLFSKEVEVFKKECVNLGIKKCVLLSGQGGEYFPVPLAFDEIISIDFTLHFTYNSYKEKVDCDLLPKYKPNDKFLFLGGVPARLNRIGLLYEFYNQGMLTADKALWSFFKPLGTTEELKCRQILNDLSNLEYQTFINYAENRFDDLYYNSKKFFLNHNEVKDFWNQITQQEWVDKPALIDSIVFDTTSLSIISEGPNYWDYSNNNNFVTEKFWRTVLHRHPFLFSGDTEQYQLIKKLGFRTFEEYFKIADYAYIFDQKKQNSAIVKNTQYFLEHQYSAAEKIKEDTEHNYNIFLQYVRKQFDVLKMMQEKFYISQNQMDYYFDQTGYKTAIIMPTTTIVS
jgi:hypothetical protein